MKKTLPGIIIIISLLIAIISVAEGSAIWLGSMKVEAPSKLTTDSTGKIYVNETILNKMSLYSRQGELLKAITGLRNPIGIAVDSTGKIYIGNDTTRDNLGVIHPGSVEIYSTGSDNSYILWKTIGGASTAEFNRPNAIGVTSSGSIYVVDSKLHKVRVYNSEGIFSFEFGGFSKGDGISTGSEDGKFNVPLDIAINEEAGELYIVDLGMFINVDGNPQEGARVQAFDLSGQFLRSFGTWGYGEGEMIRPVGIAIDKMKRLSVTDSLQEKVHIFDLYGNFQESIHDTNHPLYTPTGITAGQDDRMMISSQSSGGGNSPTVEIYGLEDYTSLEVLQKTLQLKGYAGATAPGQDLTINNKGAGDMQWTIEKTEGGQWIILSSDSGQTSGGAGGTVTISGDLSSLSAGTYTGKIKVKTGGAEEEVIINLEVLTAPVLEVTPPELIYTGHEGGAVGAQTISITLGKDLIGGISWTAAGNATWLKISPESGSADATTIATVTADTTGLAAGIYNGTITVTAAGASGSPAEVKVTMTLISAGNITVTTNIDTASWKISGTASYQGSGKTWSQADAPAGQYSISFDQVKGYTKPKDQSFTVQTGLTAAIDAKYNDIVAAKKIIAAAPLGDGRKSYSEIRVLNADGSSGGADFTAFSLKYGATVAAGDIDGDGIDEIIAGAGEGNPSRVKIFKADGSAIPGLDFIAFKTRYGATVAAGDLDGDGKAEIIVGNGIGKGSSANIRVFKYIDGEMKDTGINTIVETSRYGVYVAAGDMDGDGKDEIITGSGPDPKSMAIVRILKVDTTAGMGKWTVTESKAITVNGRGIGAIVATGDLNGDGTKEILTAGNGRNLTVKTYKADGSPYAVEISDIKQTGVVSIAAGDIDSDGKAEIIISTEPYRETSAGIRVYSSDGTFRNSFPAFSQQDGVNVGLGKTE